MSRIRKRAKAVIGGGDTVIARWWARKYKRPINDPLYTQRTLGSLFQEMLEDLFVRREELRAELQETTGAASLALSEQLTALEQLLDEERRVETGAVMTGDPLADEWEAAIERGEEPDLTKGMKRPPPKQRG